MITSTSATLIQPRRDNSRRRAAIWLCQHAYAQLHRSTHAIDEDVSRHRIMLHMLFQDVLTRLFFVSSLGWTMFANRNRLSHALLQGVMLGWRQKYTRLMSGTRSQLGTILKRKDCRSRSCFVFKFYRFAKPAARAPVSFAPFASRFSARPT